MRGYTADLAFYLRFIDKDTTVLELGCGTGRLSRLLAPYTRTLTGLDLSPGMLDRARASSPSPNTRFEQGDMRDFSLGNLYGAIIIPYNTLNLAGSMENAARCLQCCRNHLSPGSSLLLPLYLPQARLLMNSDEKLFQFAIFDDGPKKLIKETLKSYSPENETTHLEERYRIRYFDDRSRNRDLKHAMLLFTPHRDTWVNLVEQAGFSCTNTWSAFDCTQKSTSASSLLLLHARRC